VPTFQFSMSGANLSWSFSSSHSPFSDYELCPDIALCFTGLLDACSDTRVFISHISGSRYKLVLLQL
jgi:hypothetical protein